MNEIHPVLILAFEFVAAAFFLTWQQIHFLKKEDKYLQEEIRELKDKLRNNKIW